MRRAIASIAAVLVLGLLPSSADAIPIHRHVYAHKTLPDGTRLKRLLAVVKVDVAPADTDEDGVANRDDSCPATFGTDGDGCPPPVVTQTPTLATDIATGSPVVGGPFQGMTTVACESSGNFADSSADGYGGGPQFDAGTWDRYGPAGYANPEDAPPDVQMAAAASIPYDAWPNC